MLVLLGGIAACSNDSNEGDGNGDGNGASTGAGGSTSGSGSGGSGVGAMPGMGGSGFDIGDGANTGGSAGMDSEDDACATSSASAEPSPAVLQFIVDTSGSMRWDARGRDNPAPGESKWEITRAALAKAAPQLPASTALGMSFYPNTEEDVPCFRADIALPIAPLGEPGSAQRQQIPQVMEGIRPLGGTPTHSAYRFGLQQLAASTLPGNKFLILITDGVPTFTVECRGNGYEEVESQPLVEEAKLAFEQGIQTFVIGSPGSEEARDALSRLASAGGTAAENCSDAGPNYCHFDMTTEDDLAAALSGALESIIGQVLSCEYPVPSPPRGESLDPNRVNVQFTSGAGEVETILKNPNGECTTGWQYSESGDQIVLCGETCERVKQDTSGKVEVLFGCATRYGGVE